MSEPEKPDRPEKPAWAREGYLQKRRQKVRDEIERNRRGEYVVPTWVLVVALIAVIGLFVSILVFF